MRVIQQDFLGFLKMMCKLPRKTHTLVPVPQLILAVMNFNALYLTTNCRHGWRYLFEMMSCFAPADSLVPYSFLALLNEEQLVNVMNNTDISDTKHIPLCGIIGCVEYHFKRRSYLKVFHVHTIGLCGASHLFSCKNYTMGLQEKESLR